MVQINPDIRKIIEENPLSFATVDKMNRPNVIGVACVKVVGKNKVLITDNYMIQTKENLDNNKNVCLAVWDKKWNGYKLIGEATYYSKGKWRQFVQEMHENKDLPAKGAIVIDIKYLIRLG